MLRSAVLLDADMTVSHALRRLAEHGYWSSIDLPETRAWLEEYVARVRRIALQTAPGSVADERAQHTAMSVGDAARLLARPAQDARVVIRRQQSVTIFWYARNATEILAALADAVRDQSLEAALNLREYAIMPTAQVRDLEAEELEYSVGVILDGQNLFAVGESANIGLPRARGRNIRSDGFRGPSVVVERNRRLARLSEVAARPMSERDFSDARDALDTAAPTHAFERKVAAYPSLDAPQQAIVGQEFDLVIGLSEEPVFTILSSGKIELSVTPGVTEIPIDLHIVAEGFASANGWRRSLVVSVESPAEARVTVSLLPLPQTEQVRLTSLCVQYAVGGVVRGWACKNIVVAKGGVQVPDADDRGQSWIGSQGVSPVLYLAAGPAKPDIEVNISKPDGNPTRGSYRCTINNAHGIPVPDASLPIELGDDANTFAKRLIDDMRLYGGEVLIHRFLENTGSTVAEKLPPEFWNTLRAVAEKVRDRPVTLQFNSAEPYVPWELALVDPPLDPARPSFLGAQVAMGRWIIGDIAIKSPPRSVLPVKAMAVMAGMYNATTGLRPLPQAIAEAKVLAESYESLPTVPLRCSAEDLNSLLEAEVTFKFDLIGGVDAVHFAGHGEVDPTRPGDAAIYLSNGKPLSPIFFRRSKLGQTRSPFIFLNACMVGAGGELLGDYGGFPGQCLHGGFCGLVGPLWAVNDEIAKAVAIEFYRQAFADSPSRSVAEILRDLRSNYKKSELAASYLAYVYYGNPHLRLTRSTASTVSAIS